MIDRYQHDHHVSPPTEAIGAIGALMKRVHRAIHSGGPGHPRNALCVSTPRIRTVQPWPLASTGLRGSVVVRPSPLHRDTSLIDNRPRLKLPQDPRHGPTVGSYGRVVSYERGSPAVFSTPRCWQRGRCERMRDGEMECCRLRRQRAPF